MVEKIDLMDVMEYFTSDLKGIEAIDTGDLIKLSCTWKQNDGMQDLQKIIQIATHLFNYELEKLSEQKAKEKEARKTNGDF